MTYRSYLSRKELISKANPSIGVDPYLVNTLLLRPNKHKLSDIPGLFEKNNFTISRQTRFNQLYRIIKEKLKLNASFRLFWMTENGLKLVEDGNFLAQYCERKVVLVVDEWTKKGWMLENHSEIQFFSSTFKPAGLNNIGNSN